MNAPGRMLHVSPGFYPPHYENHLPKKKEVDFEIEQELAVLKEWGEVQKNFLDTLFLPPTSTCSWRDRIEDGIYQCTQGQACIWWEPLPEKCLLGNGHFIEICQQQTRYGILKFTSGYLVSHLAPHIHQMLGQLCALALHLAEHQAFVEALLKPLQPVSVYEVLSPREKEVLECMALGKNEDDIAEQLSIALTTVRTHRHKIYSRLQVHTPQDAVLRSFALRLLNWLDISEHTHSAEGRRAADNVLPDAARG